MLLRGWRAMGAGARGRSSVAAAASLEAPRVRSEEWAQAKPFDAIPGPRPFPVVGNLPRFWPGLGQYGKIDMVEMQYKLREEFGEIVRVSGIIGKKDMVFLFNPEIVEKMFRNEGRWPTREGVKTIHYYRTVMRKDKYEGAYGTVSTQGEEWHKFRTKVNQPLMQPKSAKSYASQIDQVAEDFIQKMRELRDENKELPGDFINELYKWSLESIGMIALDTRLGCLAPNLAPDSEPQKMIDAVQVMLEGIYQLDLRPSLWRLVSTPMWRRLVKALDFFYDVSEKYVNEAVARRASAQNLEPSILERLMEEDPRVAKVMVSDLLFGGVDTTSHLSASLLFHLSKHPRAQRAAGAEVRRALPSPQTPVTAEALDALPYLKACVKESLRMFPIAVGNLRETQAELVLGEYQIPKGVDIFMGHAVMGNDPRQFPRPSSFEPERWLRGGPGAHAAHPFASLPFGFGPRTCVGRRFAEMEVLTLVAKILRNFSVEYHYGDKIQSFSGSLNQITNPLKFRLIEHQ